MTIPATPRLGWLSPLALASAVAGAALLALGGMGDLAVHNEAHHRLLEQMPAACVRFLAQHEAQEANNPWHGTLVAGEGFLVLGLGGLYLSERLRRPRTS